MLQANLMGLFVDDVQAGDLWHSVVNLGTAEIVKTSLPDFAGRDRSWRIEQTKLLKVFSRVVVKRSVNFADDQINAPGSCSSEAAFSSLSQGRMVIVNAGENSLGHQTLSRAEVWQSYVAELLTTTE